LKASFGEGSSNVSLPNINADQIAPLASHGGYPSLSSSSSTIV